MKEMVKSLESELQSSSSALTAANDNVKRYQSKANQLQAIVESAERTRQQQDRGIKKETNKVQEARVTITKLNSRTSESLISSTKLLQYYSHYTSNIFVLVSSTGGGAIPEGGAHCRVAPCTDHA